MRILVAACEKQQSGPAQKFLGWAEAFSLLGHSVHLLILPGAEFTEKLSQALLNTRWDVVLLRTDLMASRAMPALRVARSLGTRVVIEIPTPYGAGFREALITQTSSWNRVKTLAAICFLNPRTWLEADLLLETAPDQAPWKWIGRDKRLTLTNGVSTSHSTLCEAWKTRTTLRMIAVASAAPWHGFDRLLRGMVNDAECELTLVGDEDRYRAIVALARELGLLRQISVVGEQVGANLDLLMADSDIGVSSLGLHRIGHFRFSPLKTRHYLAAGLPVIYSGTDPDLGIDSTPFALQASASDSPIDLSTARRWIHTLRASQLTANDISQFAQAKFSYSDRAALVLSALQ